MLTNTGPRECYRPGTSWLRSVTVVLFLLFCAGTVSAQHPKAAAPDWRCYLAGNKATCEGATATDLDPQVQGIPLDRFRKVLSIAPALVERRVKPCKVLSATLEPRSDKLSVGGKYTTGIVEK